jgi:hypothetical protein
MNAAVRLTVVRAGPLSLIGAGGLCAEPDGVVAARAPAISTPAIEATPGTVASLLILIGVLVVLDCVSSLSPSQTGASRKRRGRLTRWYGPFPPARPS